MNNPFDKLSTPEYSEFIYKSRYARWIEEKGRRETWDETVERYIDFWAEKFPNIEEGIWKAIYDKIYNLEVMPSMRCLMTAGKALHRDNVAGYNCAAVAVDDQRVFDEIFYILMCGTGAGFSVERQYVNKLPKVAEAFYKTDTVIVPHDSKIGWSTAYRELISLLYSGKEPKWDFSKIRPAGARLITFGGRASGPLPLEELFQFTIAIFKGAVGRKLTSIECHDIVCKIAAVVVVGSVRRSALISFSNLSDNRMAVAKSGSWWENNSQRALANNSVRYTEKPEIDVFLKEWLNLYESKSGERGIFNNEAANKLMPQRRKELNHTQFLSNPCSLAGSSLLLTSDGYKRFDELVGKDIEIVNNLGHATKGTVWISGIDKDVVRLDFDGEEYEPIICTPDHRFMLLDGSECEAKDLLGLHIQLLHTGSLLVNSVKSNGKATVYDFTEPQTHWGVTTNGIVTHNSEIVLRDTGQFCNLTEVIVRPEDTLEDLLEKIEIASIMGTFQATLTDFRYLRQQWKTNCDEEALLGVSLTGIMDHPVLNCSRFNLLTHEAEGTSVETISWLNQMRDRVVGVNKKWSEILGINQSAATTAVKPSGTVSQLTDTASGIHPRYAPYYTRTVRADVKDPLAKLMMDIGVPNEPDVTKPDSTVIFSFPVKAPECSVFRDDRTAIEQLELWKLYQLHYCDHKPSITVYVKEHEWIAVASWVYENFDIVSGVSFLPHSDHSYRQAPYQEITKEQYEEDIKKVKHPNWTELSRYEIEDQTTNMKEYACTGGMCEI